MNKGRSLGAFKVFTFPLAYREELLYSDLGNRGIVNEQTI